MGFIQDLFTRFFGAGNLASVPVGGTIATPTGVEIYPVALAQQIVGAPKFFIDLEDMADCPLGWLQEGNPATVKEYLDIDGKTVPRSEYKFIKLPVEDVERISDIPGYDLSQYWKLVSTDPTIEAELQTQYAPNCNAITGAKDLLGVQPPFPGKGSGRVVTYAEYASLVDGATIALASAGSNPIEGYWESTHDSTKGHVWMRQRYGSNGKWGIPVKMTGETYEARDYISNMFKWSVSQPVTPPQFLDGVSNSEPATWTDTIPGDPGGGAKLWVIKSQKSVYGILKTPWMDPIEVRKDATLVRYSEKRTPDPNSVDYADLAANGWEITPAINRIFMASRPTTDDPWVVEGIFNESGEYQAFVFKLFTLDQVATVQADPEAYLPEGPNPAGWQEGVPTPADNQVIFMSSAMKYSDGSLKTEWSNPTLFSSDNKLSLIIITDPGDDFKTNPNTDVTSPSAITLTAKLYKGNQEITPTSYSWKKIFDNGNLVASPPELSDTDSLVVEPADITGKAIFEITVEFGGLEEVQTISILDLSDGMDAETLVLTANSNIITQKADLTRLPAAVTIKAYSTNLSDENTLTWFKKIGSGSYSQIMSGMSPYTGSSLAVTYSDFNSTTEITYKAVSVDGLEDEFTVYQVSQLVGEAGSPAVVLVLNPENYQLVLNEATGTIDYAYAFTGIKIYEGITDVTEDYYITIANTDVTAALSGVTSDGTGLSGENPVVTLSAMPSNKNNGYSLITATNKLDSEQVLSRRFEVSKVTDRIGSLDVDIDSSNNGFAFSPSVVTDKILTAKLYVNHNLQTTGVTYLWDTGATTESITVTKASVTNQRTVSCTVTYLGVSYLRTISILSVPESKGLGILYTTSSVDSGSNPVSSDDIPPGSVAYNATSAGPYSGVSWTNSAVNAIYMILRKEGESSWSGPFRIKGETGATGSTGATGNYFRNIFKATNSGDPAPATPSGNYPVTGWSDTPPAIPTDGYLWISWGQLNQADQIQGLWTAPRAINGANGADGDAGSAGADGDSAYQVAVDNGFIGSEADWLESLIGEPGFVFRDLGTTDFDDLIDNGVYTVGSGAVNSPIGMVHSPPTDGNYLVVVFSNEGDNVVQTAYVVEHDSAAIANNAITIYSRRLTKFSGIGAWTPWYKYNDWTSQLEQFSPSGSTTLSGFLPAATPVSLGSVNILNSSSRSRIYKVETFLEITTPTGDGNSSYKLELLDGVTVLGFAHESQRREGTDLTTTIHATGFITIAANSSKTIDTRLTSPVGGCRYTAGTQRLHAYGI